MSPTDVMKFLESEMERAVIEARGALSVLAIERRLSGSCSRLIAVIDKYEFKVTLESGESAFELDSDTQTITFRGSALIQVWNSLDDLSSEVDLGTEETLRAKQAGFNQLVIHELIHVTQLLWDFSAIPDVKAGLPKLGLPILDLAADVESAFMSAQIECSRLGITDDDSILRQIANALLRAYVIGAFVFDARTNPAKRQRAIGLIISLVLIQAKADKRLGADVLNPNWTPIAPVLAFDISESHRFNGFILSEHIGLLLSHNGVPDGDLLDELWESVGSLPVERIISLVSTFLKAAGAITSNPS